MYLRYSSSVVAPTQCSSPRASAGLSMLPASIAPSPLPAPTMVCSSSMKTMVWPSSFASSLSTVFRRSSNSPRNLAPASSAAMSSDSTRLPLSDSGTSPATMRWARPSTMAVLPTPGSPMSTGLFLVRRCSTWMVRRISSSRPMTGSSLPRRARSVRSRQYFLRASRWPSASALFTPCPPRTASMADSSDLRLRPLSLAILPMSALLSATASRKSSPAMNWSLRLMASFSVACSSLPSSGPTCTMSWPCTWGSFLMAPSAACSSPGTLTPARSSRARGPSSWRSIATSRCAGSM
ncbi:hypothetical protein D3C72_1273780 [compost metagenome]